MANMPAKHKKAINYRLHVDLVRAFKEEARRRGWSDTDLLTAALITELGAAAPETVSARTDRADRPETRTEADHA